MRCGGCGAKVGATVLSKVMAKLDAPTRDDVVSSVCLPLLIGSPLSLSYALAIMMRSTEFDLKIYSHADSLILSVSVYISFRICLHVCVCFSLCVFQWHVRLTALSGAGWTGFA